MRLVSVLAMVFAAVGVSACGAFLGLSGNEDSDDAPQPIDAGADAVGDASGQEASGEFAVDGGDGGVRPTKRVFVTSGMTTGNLGGVAGADQRCTELAQSAGVEGDFVAYLAEKGTPPEMRLPKGVRWTLVDGTVVFDDDPGTSLPLVPISLAEDGSPLVSGYVWTGVADPNGGFETCENWATEDTMVNGGIGDPTSTTSEWQTAGKAVAGCGLTAALYCFER